LTVEQLPPHQHAIYSGYGDIGDAGANTDAYRYQWWGGYNRGWHGDNLGTSYVGGGQPHANMQPYCTLYMWRRTA